MPIHAKRLQSLNPFAAPSRNVTKCPQTNVAFRAGTGSRVAIRPFPPSHKAANTLTHLTWCSAVAASVLGVVHPQIPPSLDLALALVSDPVTRSLRRCWISTPA
jgi:hypothetical protein